MKPLLATAATYVLLTTAALAQNTGTANFVDAEGKPSGAATLTSTSTGVLIELEVNGLPSEEWVAFHVHETGSCDHTTGHDSAGGHFNPADVEHGYMTETGPHAGDMPNIYVPASGTAKAQVFNSLVALDDSENGIVGRALMIHANADDYSSQPSGDAGNRLACAVIE
ncbi:superoxide dismutase family protein [Aureimonas fodinaquatilis]|uniref:Superoxide dismutase [Cu-Zn] n=1 Tax=Aureimonas fodinaquatilis TaxID=2565783 RepID=A0A5B0DW28_9HYPH|nr:superoxide dismutase family protein [Aureimonas fodinaquatilis]KAA0969780.1 superoxide dismutase family protein [Aureimonas fodinaquatilis]